MSGYSMTAMLHLKHPRMPQRAIPALRADSAITLSRASRNYASYAASLDSADQSAGVSTDEVRDLHQAMKSERCGRPRLGAAIITPAFRTQIDCSNQWHATTADAQIGTTIAADNVAQHPQIRRLPATNLARARLRRNADKIQSRMDKIVRFPASHLWA
jgi:hypothetical protein